MRPTATAQQHLLPTLGSALRNRHITAQRTTPCLLASHPISWLFTAPLRQHRPQALLSGVAFSYLLRARGSALRSLSASSALGMSMSLSLPRMMARCFTSL